MEQLMERHQDRANLQDGQDVPIETTTHPRLMTWDEINAVAGGPPLINM